MNRDKSLIVVRCTLIQGDGGVTGSRLVQGDGGVTGSRLVQGDGGVTGSRLGSKDVLKQMQISWSGKHKT